MKIEVGTDKESVDVNAEFPSTYKKIETLMMAGKAAAEKNDVATLHQIHGQILGAAIDLQNASFFGLAIRHIEEATSKSAPPANDADIPDPHPV